MQIRLATIEPKNKEAFTFETCIRCSRVQKTCCSDRPRVPFTIDDLDRIQALGHRLEDFAIAGEYKGNDVLPEEEEWWRDSMVEVDEKLYKLNAKLQDSGACHFLVEGKGCSLGDDRPSVCKIYPFWINEQDQLYIEQCGWNCLICEEHENKVSPILRSVNEIESSIREHFQAIKEDCEKNKEQHANLVAELLEVDVEKQCS